MYCYILMNFRDLESNDYYKNYLYLLEQLTEVNVEQITFEKFFNFVNNLNCNHRIIVLEEDNKIVASGSLLIENKIIHGISKVGHIEDIVVDKNVRGKGLGKNIINYLNEIGKLNNCYKIILNCKESNIKFYENCGFENKEFEMVKYYKKNNNKN